MEWEDAGVQNHTRAEDGNSQQDTIKHRSQVSACVGMMHVCDVCEGVRVEGCSACEG